MRYFLILIFLSGVFIDLSAQKSPLESYLEIGLKNNIDLIMQQLKVQRNHQQMRAAKGKFMPDLDIGIQYTRAEGGRTINIPLADLINPVHETLNELTDSNRFPANLRNREVMFLPDNFHETRLRVIQPIFNTNIFYNYKARQEMVSLQEVRKKAYLNELVKEIKVAYFNYLRAYQSKALLHKQKKLLKHTLKLNQSLVENEKTTKEKVYQARYALDQLVARLTEAHKNMNLARAQFNFLLNRDLETPLKRDSFNIQSLDFDSLDYLKSQSLVKRPEIKSLRKAGLLSEIELSRQKANRYLPSLNLAGEAGYQGFDWQFGAQQQYYLLALNLQWDLFDGFQNDAKVQQAKISRDLQNQKLKKLEQQIQLQVIQRYYDLAESRKKYAAERSSRALAEKSFTIVEAKYLRGRALFIEYLDAQTQLEQSLIEENLAKYQVLINKAKLEHAIGNFE